MHSIKRHVLSTALVNLESSHLIGRELCELGHEARYVHVLVVVKVAKPPKIKKKI